jgi:hypothetical protein
MKDPLINLQTISSKKASWISPIVSYSAILAEALFLVVISNNGHVFLLVI